MEDVLDMVGIILYHVGVVQSEAQEVQKVMTQVQVFQTSRENFADEAVTKAVGMAVDTLLRKDIPVNEDINWV